MIPARSRLSIVSVFHKMTFRIMTSIICGLGIALITVFLKQKSLVIITCLSVYLLSGLIIYISQGRLKIFTPSSLFFTLYSLMLFIGSLIFYYSIGDVQLPAIVTAAIFFFSLGVLGASLFLEFRPREEFYHFMKCPWRDYWQNPATYLALSIIVLFAILLASIFFARFGIPILSKNVEEARLSAVRNSSYLFPGFRLLFTFSLAIMMVKSQLYKSKWLIFELILIGLAFFSFLGTAFRTSLAALIVLFLLSRQFYKGKLAWKKILILSIVFMILFGFITWQRYTYGFSDRSLIDLPRFIFRAVSHRILLNNIYNLRFIFDYFPFRHKYLYGGSFLMDLKAASPGPDIGFGGWLTTKMNPDLAGIAGMTPTITGELYANFGVIGVILGMFLLGFLIQTFYVLFIKGKKRVSRVALALFLTLGIGWSVIDGLGNFLISKFIPILIVYILLQLTSYLKPVKSEIK